MLNWLGAWQIDGMAHYRVNGGGWWESWTMPFAPGRPASAEEAKIMDKIVWQKDTPADRAKLNKLLKTE